MFKFRKKRLDKKMKTTTAVPSDVRNTYLSSDLLTNEQTLKELFMNCLDFIIRPIKIENGPTIMFLYLESLTDAKTLNTAVLEPFLFQGLPDGLNSVDSLGQIIEQKLLAAAPVKTVLEVGKLVDEVLKGSLAVLVDGRANALIANMQGVEQRAIEEPETEVVIRGPRDGFNELLQTNIALIRRRIRSTRLKLEKLTIGELSQTDVVIAYIEGIASEPLLQEVRQRVERIQIDAVLESEFIEEFIEDVPYSPFPQIQNTERPDSVAANLLEGKVAILVDNTPFALILPMTFWDGFQASEDAYERFIYVSFIRLIRFTMFNVSMYLPSLYVALTTFHPRLIPTALLMSITAARENVPFPAIIEAFLMELVFEGLREAGIRLPKAVGSAVSIVGALVVGQAAVQAGIVSAPMVIVVATTGIASFAVPRYNIGTALRLVRFPLLILAGMFGLYGIVIGFIVLMIHLVNLRSFGVPYFTPFAPQIPADIKSVLVRTPKWRNRFGPFFTFGRRKPRIHSGQKPGPQKGGRNNEK